LRRLAAPLGVLALLLAAAGVACAQEDLPCDAAIDPTLAQAVFDRLRGAPGADGCALEGAATERTRMELRWAREGAVVARAHLEPAECASGAPRAERLRGVALQDARELAGACPDAHARVLAALAATAEVSTLPPRIVARGDRSAALLAIAALSIALLGALGLALRALHRAPAP
jgi:hypothetical protein